MATQNSGRRGERRGQAVEKKPTGVAERRADRAAERERLDARTKRPTGGTGRLERPDLENRAKSRS